MNGFEMIYGDEWVRAIFRKKDNVNSINNKISFDNNSLDVMSHLKKVEKDYLKLSNFVSRLTRLIGSLLFKNDKIDESSKLVSDTPQDRRGQFTY